MKHLLSLFALLLVGALRGQNLVPNGSFEEHTACPTGDDQVNYATGWESYMYSPDFWHACGIPGTSSVPSNIAGYQEAHSGAGYGGVHAVTSQGQSADGYREIMGIQLVNALESGAEYHVRFFASWTTTAVGTQVSVQYANNKLGAFFTTYVRTGFPAWYPLPNFAHVYTNEIITDSVGWTEVQGDFIADSAYTFLYLGNFFGDLETDDTLINPGGQFGLSYYYLDDVCVTLAGDACDLVGFPATSFLNNIKVGPNPFEEVIWLQGSDENLVHLTLRSIAGQEILATVSRTGQNKSCIELPDLPPGPYMLTLASDHSERRHVLLMRR